ncbi:hypothetical protein COT97_00205 [Candidatus Falkowbacteria bacterium CG10_big_fil_rev_8_21_14_0_10_39_11]|uniref:Uncharacterized protein n=1 Tax=Candidatus Falkowbacteria bacterium CG10_big_fil_rev_8_21_14_0_10_39_11 TaxID=1974565 RepID=A0A2H0V6H2_9BACT|nr:MAG: hypothetical protein COT97_00205 [Candidatus Falkowbacteria bacterium CG10_big_fil_rev_8_21_14_0_10_39_11]
MKHFVPLFIAIAFVGISFMTVPSANALVMCDVDMPCFEIEGLRSEHNPEWHYVLATHSGFVMMENYGYDWRALDVVVSTEDDCFRVEAYATFDDVRMYRVFSGVISTFQTERRDCSVKGIDYVFKFDSYSYISYLDAISFHELYSGSDFPLDM